MPRRGPVGDQDVRSVLVGHSYGHARTASMNWQRLATASWSARISLAGDLSGTKMLARAWLGTVKARSGRGAWRQGLASNGGRVLVRKNTARRGPVGDQNVSLVLLGQSFGWVSWMCSPIFSV